MTAMGDEQLLMLQDFSLEEEVITYYDVDFNLDLTDDNLADLVTLSPAEVSSESFTLSSTEASFTANLDPCPSVSSSSSFCSPEDPDSIIYSPSSLSSVSEECSDVKMSPSEVFCEGRNFPKKKRGRKPKSASGSCSPTSQTVKVKRLRAYEVNKPYEDKEKEKKRVNAIKAKKHRDSQKMLMQDLQQQTEQVKAERDKLQMEKDWLTRELEALRLKNYDAEREMLKTELENERRKVTELTRKFEFCKRHWKAQSLQIMKLLQKPPVF